MLETNLSGASSSQFTVQELISELFQSFGSEERLPFTLVVHAGVLDIRGDIAQLSHTIKQLARLMEEERLSGKEIRLEICNRRFFKKDIHDFYSVRPGEYVEFVLSSSSEREREGEALFACYFPKKMSELLGSISGVIKYHNGDLIAASDERGISYQFLMPGQKKPKRHHECCNINVVNQSACTILVADKDEMILQIVESGLKLQGYRVLLARDGNDALRRFRRHKDSISLVFADTALPSIDGLSLIKNICAEKPETRVILTSALSTGHDYSSLRNMEYGAFISKPYPLVDLFALIECLLKCH